MTFVKTRQGVTVPRATKHCLIAWKVWHDHNTGLWSICRRDGKGGICVVRKLEFRELDVQSDGRFLYCEAELIANGKTNVVAPNLVEADHAILRMLRVYDQVVHLPVIARASPTNVIR